MAPASSALLVPQSAISRSEGRDIVFVVNAGRAERRAVLTGETRGKDILVESGLSAGEAVVVEGPPELADGDAVREKKK